MIKSATPHPSSISMAVSEEPSPPRGEDDNTIECQLQGAQFPLWLTAEREQDLACLHLERATVTNIIDILQCQIDHILALLGDVPYTAETTRQAVAQRGADNGTKLNRIKKKSSAAPRCLAVTELLEKIPLHLNPTEMFGAQRVNLHVSRNDGGVDAASPEKARGARARLRMIGAVSMTLTVAEGSRMLPGPLSFDCFHMKRRGP